MTVSWLIKKMSNHFQSKIKFNVVIRSQIFPSNLNCYKGNKSVSKSLEVEIILKQCFLSNQFALRSVSLSNQKSEFAAEAKFFANKSNGTDDKNSPATTKHIFLHKLLFIFVTSSYLACCITETGKILSFWRGELSFHSKYGCFRYISVCFQNYIFLARISYL